MPLSPDDVRRILSTAILESNLAQSQLQADQLASTLAPRLASTLADAAPPAPADGSLMTAAEALFVRDTIAAELESVGGASVAERLIVAGYIDVGPILLRHRMLGQESPRQVAEATGPLQAVSSIPASATETGRIARRVLDAKPLPDFPRTDDGWGDDD